MLTEEHLEKNFKTEKENPPTPLSQLTTWKQILYLLVFCEIHRDLEPYVYSFSSYFKNQQWKYFSLHLRFFQRTIVNNTIGYRCLVIP